MPTLEQVFQAEKACIAECDDVDALIDKIGDWRESLRVAERDGEQLVRMRAGDLVNLARSRVVRLQAGAIRGEDERNAAPRAAAPTAANPAPRPAEVQRQTREARAPETRADDGAARREQERRDREQRARTEAALAEAEKAKAAARLAEAEAARVEAQIALLRAQADAARRVAVAPAGRTSAATVPTPQRAVEAKPVAAAVSPVTKTATAVRPTATARPPAAPNKQAPVQHSDDVGYTEADRLALASVGHWPPTPPGHRGAFWTKHEDWPRDWTLTGGDLGRFRGEINLTRAVFAAQLGVPSAVVKDAEMSPRKRVGPALQIALRRAMDHAIQARRARREERAAAEAPPASSPESAPKSASANVPSTSAPIVVVEAASGERGVFTGADLAGMRAERRLLQREMADLLGVEQGTISKGEGKADAALGPALQAALRQLTLGGGAGRGPAIPE